MSAEARMREKLLVALEPTRLDIVNESELHAGHRSSPGTGESHFRILIVSPKFSGASRVERHRMVNAALAGRAPRPHPCPRPQHVCAERRHKIGAPTGNHNLNGPGPDDRRAPRRLDVQSAGLSARSRASNSAKLEPRAPRR